MIMIRRSKKTCRLCRDKVKRIDYKDLSLIQRFITERGKIIPSRITGNCAYHQRQMSRAIKRARIMAMVPFAAE